MDQRERESGAAHVNKPRGYTATLQKVLTIGLFAAVLLLAAVRLSLENQFFLGFGTLALKKAVREHLRGHPQVTSWREAAPNEGGGGATVV